VYLSFEHVPRVYLEAAFGPVIDRLARHGIDLTRSPVEVSPIAHYHMGGIAVDATMASRVPGLYAAGEAVGGANGANRLSGNAIPEALVFGRRAGESAAALARNTPVSAFSANAARAALDLIQASDVAAGSSAAAIRTLQDVMQQHAGPLRSAEGLRAGFREIIRLRSELPERPPP